MEPEVPEEGTHSRTMSAQDEASSRYTDTYDEESVYQETLEEEENGSTYLEEEENEEGSVDQEAMGEALSLVEEDELSTIKEGSLEEGLAEEGSKEDMRTIDEEVRTVAEEAETVEEEVKPSEENLKRSFDEEAEETQIGEETEYEERSGDRYEFANELVRDLVDRTLNYEELDEIPGEADLMVDQLGDDEPLSDWITSLLPGIKDVIPSTEVEGEAAQGEEVPEEEMFDFSPSEAPNILAGDSPLMKRFQEALKNHLLRQKQRLLDDISDMEAECRKKTGDKDILGESIYREQQHLTKQSEMIEKYKSGICEVNKKLEHYENILNTQTDDHKRMTKEYKESVKQDKTLLDQNEEIAELLQRLAALEAAQTTELKFSKNLSDKQKLDKIKMAKEKQQQDMLIWKLTRELNKLTQGAEVLIEQATEKKKEIGILQQCIANVETDTSGLRKENHLIMNATERLINELKHRDKTYYEADNQLKVGYAQVQLINSRIRSYNKSTHSELEKCSIISQRKGKAEKSFHRLSITESGLKERKESLMDELAELQNLILTAEEDLKAVLTDHKELKKKHTALIAVLDELTSKRNELEQRFASVMSEKKIQSASYQNLQKAISNLGKENQDIGLLKLENDCRIGQLMMDIEKAKVARIQVEVKIDSFKNSVKEKETELKSIAVSRKKVYEKIVSLKSKVIGAKKRLVLINKMTDESESRCLVVKRIATLKTELEKLDSKVQEARKIWMETQNSLIEDNLKLSQLEVSTNTIRKHLFLTTYKKEKLEAKLEEAEKEEKKTRRQLSTYQRKFNVLTSEILKVEENCDKLASMAKATEGKYIEALQDAETATVKLQREICELQESNVEMEEEVEQLQRELLAWEKKWQMAVETRERIDRERASGGEIGTMKTEIHRMHVRFAQLKKVQDKLTTDLELSIARRDNIIDQAYAREKRSEKGKHQTKTQFLKKLDEIRNKIKHTNQSIKQAEQDLQMMETKRYDLMTEIDKKREELDQLRDGVCKLEVEIQEGQLHKYKSLELIVRRQKKIRYLEDIKTNKYRLFFKQESSLLNEEEKQNNVNSNLIEIVETLMADFPPLRLQTLQIINTLTMVID